MKKIIINMIKLRRFTLMGIFFISLSTLFIGISTFFLYFHTDAEQLIGHYPYYDEATKGYKLSKTKPAGWVSGKEVDYYAKWAIIVSEDWAFYGHDGFDLNQIRIVVGESIKEGKLMRGASTITQQVVKNALLNNERTLWRKFRELVLAYKLEKILTKDKILEIYLNIVEMGDGIFGIKQASKYYFSKDPGHLTAREGAFLAMLLPSPKKYAQSFRRKELSPFAKKQVNKILLKLEQAKIYSSEDRAQALQTHFSWEKMPEIIEETSTEPSPDFSEESDHLDYEAE